MIDQCSLLFIPFMFGVIYLPVAILRNTRCMALEIPVAVFSYRYNDQTHLYDVVV
jgi:hypothetical protein